MNYKVYKLAQEAKVFKMNRATKTYISKEISAQKCKEIKHTKKDVVNEIYLAHQKQNDRHDNKKSTIIPIQQRLMNWKGNKIVNILNNIIQPEHMTNSFFYRSDKLNINLCYEEDKNGYAKSCSYNMKIYYYKIGIPENFKIAKNSIIDGIYNISFNLYKKVNNISIYKAIWIEKRRGFNFEIISGWIANTNTDNEEFYYHADTIKKAINGVDRKQHGYIRKVEKQKKYIEKMNNLQPETKIGISEFANITGACIPGIRNYCAEINISYKKKQSIQDIIKLIKDNNNNISNATYYAEKLEKSLVHNVA